MIFCHGRLSHSVFALLLTLSVARADWRDDAGFPQLQAELGSSLPTGANVSILVSEADENGTSPGTPYLPQTTAGSTAFAGTGNFSGTSITPRSGPSNTSGHSASVAHTFCGNTSSLTPGVVDLQVWLADDFLNGIYAGSNNNPPASFLDANNQICRVQNHSWVGSTLNTALDTELIRRLDFMISRDDAVVITPMNNGSSMTKLQANAYHGISVGLRSGNHPTTHSNLDTNGRMKPDLVVNQGFTSFAGPAVGSAATLLLDAITQFYPAADDARVVKAILSAAASKQNLLGWKRNNHTRPYDETYGAGELNILNAYHILSSGQQTASASQWRSLRGWDAGVTQTAQPQLYFFRLLPGQWGASVSASVTWHRDLTPTNNFTTSSLANLDLRLYRANGFSLTTVVDASLSAVDNTEHLFLRNLPPGDYALEVSAPAANVPYGLAWEVQSGTGPQIQIQRTGSQSMLNLSSLDPLTSYTLQSSTDMQAWTGVSTFRTADTVPSVTHSVQHSTAAARQFYRLIW
jgi:hypothetical protein